MDRLRSYLVVGGGKKRGGERIEEVYSKTGITPKKQLIGKVDQMEL